MEYLVEVSHVGKRYGEVEALRDVSKSEGQAVLGRQRR